MTACAIEPTAAEEDGTPLTGCAITADGGYAARLARHGDCWYPERWTLGPEPYAVPLPGNQPEEPGTEVQPLADGRVLIRRFADGRHTFSLLYPTGPGTGELLLGAVECPEDRSRLRLLPPAPDGVHAYALEVGRHSSTVWLVAGGAFGPERLAEVPGRCSGGVWLDRAGRMLALDREVAGCTKAVVVDLEHGEVSPLLQIAHGSDDRLLLADPDSGLLVIRSDAPGEDRLGWGVLGSTLPVRFPESLRMPRCAVTPFAAQPGQVLTPESCAVALRVDGPLGTWVGVWRPDRRRVDHLAAPHGWLAGAGLWTPEGVLRLPCTTAERPCGVADLRVPGIGAGAFGPVERTAGHSLAGPGVPAATEGGTGAAPAGAATAAGGAGGAGVPGPGAGTDGTTGAPEGAGASGAAGPSRTAGPEGHAGHGAPGEGTGSRAAEGNHTTAVGHELSGDPVQDGTVDASAPGRPPHVDAPARPDPSGPAVPRPVPLGMAPLHALGRTAGGAAGVRGGATAATDTGTGTGVPGAIVWEKVASRPTGREPSAAAQPGHIAEPLPSGLAPHTAQEPVTGELPPRARDMIDPSATAEWPGIPAPPVWPEAPTSAHATTQFQAVAAVTDDPGAEETEPREHAAGQEARARVAPGELPHEAAESTSEQPRRTGTGAGNRHQLRDEAAAAGTDEAATPEGAATGEGAPASPRTPAWAPPGITPTPVRALPVQTNAGTNRRDPAQAHGPTSVPGSTLSVVVDAGILANLVTK